MKIISLTLSLLFLPLLVLTASPKPVLELVEVLTKKAGGRVPSRAAVESLEIAFKKFGPEALTVTERVGIELAESAARYGTDVFKFAIRVPEAAPALALQAERLLPLARKHGDIFLKLEAQTPGLAEDAFRVFGSNKDINRILKLPPEDAKAMLSYAAHATDKKAAHALLTAVEKQGTGFLSNLTKGQIIASGLTAGMVVVAVGTGTAIVSSPGVFTDAVQPIIWILGLVLGGALIYVLFPVLTPVRSFFRRFGRKKKSSYGSPADR